MSDLGVRAEVTVTLTDFKGKIEPLELTPIPDKNHFLDCGLRRGIVALVARNVTPHHAIRVEYEDAAFYGVADCDGVAELLAE